MPALRSLILTCACLLPLSAEAQPSIRAVVQAIIAVESGGNARARGSAGEYGLMQIRCATARSVGFKGKCSRLLDPAVNRRYGTAYFRAALKRTGGNVWHAVSLYHRGIYSRYRGCSAYCRKVKRAM